MSNATKYSGKAASIPTGMAVSAVISILATLIMSAGIASYLNMEKITWEQAGYWIMGMLFTAAFLSGKCAYSVIKRQRLAVSVMSGLLYWGMLLCITALFFGGSFEAIWETGGIIAAGCSTAALVTLPKNRKYRKNSRTSNR